MRKPRTDNNKVLSNFFNFTIIHMGVFGVNVVKEVQLFKNLNLHPQLKDWFQNKNLNLEKQIKEINLQIHINDNLDTFVTFKTFKYENLGNHE